MVSFFPKRQKEDIQNKIPMNLFFFPAWSIVLVSGQPGLLKENGLGAVCVCVCKGIRRKRKKRRRRRRLGREGGQEERK